MKTANKALAMILVAAAGMLCLPARAADSDKEVVPTTKQERNLIREGNSLYRQKRYADAEVKYRKALEEVPQSETALFNLAASLIRQSGSADPNSGNNPIKDASEILRQLGKEGFDTNLSGKAFYNLGNISFNNNDFAGAVDMYKHSLRKNPNDDKARQNLRIAQKKLEQQQQDQQNQNQDKQNQAQHQTQE
ncbi:MAG: tetratricopeptide repeat protein, partial [Paramuribaculum sp.]|nr:tetratricopeptide repeat protein [Paramuribaculum sp.]